MASPLSSGSAAPQGRFNATLGTGDRSQAGADGAWDVGPRVDATRRDRRAHASADAGASGVGPVGLSNLSGKVPFGSSPQAAHAGTHARPGLAPAAPATPTKAKGFASTAPKGASPESPLETTGTFTAVADKVHSPPFCAPADSQVSGAACGSSTDGASSSVPPLSPLAPPFRRHPSLSLCPARVSRMWRAFLCTIQKHGDDEDVWWKSDSLPLPSEITP